MPLHRGGTPCVRQGEDRRKGNGILPARPSRAVGRLLRRLWRTAIRTVPLLTLAVALQAPARAQQPGASGAGAEAERCIAPASHFHQVNPRVLRAILKVESGLNPRAIGRNRDGSVDVGIGQINSIHFGELALFGIAPGHLLDACIGTYVAAWHLRRQIARHGNTWFGVAAYHSVTPRHNMRYQLLVHRELRKAQ